MFNLKIFCTLILKFQHYCIRFLLNLHGNWTFWFVYCVFQIPHCRTLLRTYFFVPYALCIEKLQDFEPWAIQVCGECTAQNTCHSKTYTITTDQKLRNRILNYTVHTFSHLRCLNMFQCFKPARWIRKHFAIK